MAGRYTYRVVWSARHQKYAVRCVERPILTALGATPQEALDEMVDLVVGGRDAAVAGSAAAEGASAGSGRPTAPPRVVPRWLTRC
ncbi:hypothetical protein [Mycobacterium sp.]|uniref:hypothetical protein n=1 Tax=Mycobacterium sp. TaxID=1785 RepID=UPI0031CE45AB